MKPVSCCVPLCANNFRISPNLCFYRIPKDIQLQKKYVASLRNKSLKLKSDNTRICLGHFDGGKKLSRNHSPRIFPWSKKSMERITLSRENQEDKVKKAKRESERGENERL